MLNRVRDGTFHEWFIPQLVSRMGATRYLELGLYEGVTIRGVRRLSPSVACVGVDTKPARFPGVETYMMTTDEFFETVAPTLAPFDITFIDADHCADSARKDFKNAMRYTTPDGLVLLHDTNPFTAADTAPGYSGNAWELLDEFNEARVEHVTLPYFPGLTIVRKRDKMGPFL